jgi:hypothetical protein
MKRIVFAVLIAAFFVFDGSTQEAIRGQKNVSQVLVKWTTGVNTKTRIRFYTGNVYLDTSTTGQGGAWKRIDNMADSCSNPFLISSDSSGTSRAVHEFRLWQSVKSVHATLGLHVYRIQTREKVYDAGIRAFRFTPWTMVGQNSGYSGQDIQDSILMLSPKPSASKSSQYSLSYVAGSMARLCPDVAPTTSTSAGDSTIADSLFFFSR